jgi:hypothetical protein
MSKGNQINNLLRSIDNYKDLQIAIDTLESVVYNFQGNDGKWLRNIAPLETKEYEQAMVRLHYFITEKSNKGELA